MSQSDGLCAQDRQQRGPDHYGAAGSGKTHLVRRLRKRLTAHFVAPRLDQLQQIFAYVRLDTSARMLARHIRNRVASDLLRVPEGASVSQFELMVVAGLMMLRDGEGDVLTWWEYYREERATEMEEAIEKLGERCQLSANFVRVLSHLVQKRHRLDVAAWLRGESLPQHSYDRLGVGIPSDDDPEQEALAVLRDFARLAGDHLPLVLCFDQIEAMQLSPDDTQSLYAYGQLMRNLCNSNRNLLLVSCMQSSLFEKLKSVLPDYQWNAMQSFPPQSLSPLRQEEAKLLLSDRLKLLQGSVGWPKDAHDLWPFSENEIAQWVGVHGTTPRALLHQAASAFDELITKSPTSDPETLAQWLTRELEDRNEAALERIQANATVEALRGGIPELLYLKDPEWKVSEEHVPHIDLVLEGPQKEARVGVVLLNNQPVSLASQLGRLTANAPSLNKLHKLVLLRDIRLPISPTATATRRHLKTLEENDAVMHWVSPEVVAAIDAARALLAASKVGDLSFNGLTVSHSTVLEWLRLNWTDALNEIAEILVLPNTGRDFDRTSVERLQELLTASPVSSFDDLQTQLNLSDQELRDTIQSKPDLFGCIEGECSAVYSVRLASRCLH